MERRPRSVHAAQIVLVTPWGQITHWWSESMRNAARSKPSPVRACAEWSVRSGPNSVMPKSRWALTISSAQGVAGIHQVLVWKQVAAGQSDVDLLRHLHIGNGRVGRGDIREQVWPAGDGRIVTSLADVDLVAF
jgi:hypothetical protein